MKNVPLFGKNSNNNFVMIDEEDYDKIIKYRWLVQIHKSNFKYAITRIKTNNKWITLMLHRLILGVTDEKILVDHLNHNGLDCRRSNLRVCTKSQNNQNQLPTRSRYGYKGIYYHKKNKKWIAGIGFNGKKYYLGCFDSKIDAAKAYDDKAVEFFREFAHLNFML